MTAETAGTSQVAASTAPPSAHAPGSFLAIERSIEIDAPPERVFAIVGDVSKSPEWAGSGEVRAVVRQTEGPIGVGTRYRSDQNIRGMKYHTTSTITDYEPNRRIIWRVEPPAYARSAWGFTLDPTPSGGTRLTHFYDADTPGGFGPRLFMKLLYRLGNRRAELGRHVEATLRNLKQLAEGKA